MNSFVHIRNGHAGDQPAAVKETLLLENLSAHRSLLVALSGGADSAYLAWGAFRALGPRSTAITAISPSFSSYDRQCLDFYLAHTGIPHDFVTTSEVENPAYRENNRDRCYHCKDELFSVMNRLAAERGVAAIAYGVNAEDTLDFRPGHRAAAKHHVLAPLLEVRLNKSEIRELSRRASLPTWDRPASACLASRIAYGLPATRERLALIDQGEAALRELGFRQFRVRLHEDRARIEIAPDEMTRAQDPEMRGRMGSRLKALGFARITLDLDGYRQGSLNEQAPVRREVAL